MTETFYPDDALPIHYLDGEGRGLCSYAGHPRNEFGGCPRGCGGATEHYSNDGHKNCAQPPTQIPPTAKSHLHGVLFSHASTMVYRDLIADTTFDDPVAADRWASDICRIQGVEFEPMTKIDGEWRSRLGETPIAVIQRRWAP